MIKKIVRPGICCFIDDKDRACASKAVDSWRVRAYAPMSQEISAYMLVPMCKRHGEGSPKRILRKNRRKP